MSTTTVDAIIIGAGQAGPPLAHALAGAGWQVALIEREHVGGTCVNEGCTPTKTMVASARVAHMARRAPEYGVEYGTQMDVTVDMTAVRQRKREVVHSFREGNRRRLEQAEKIELIMGEARFTGPQTVEVALNYGDTRTLRAEHIFINTGARPRKPELSGLDDVAWLDSTTIMELAEVPKHLLVLGGGYIGLEFAQMFRRFGSEVTIVQRGEQLLTREDQDIADAVAEILREDGITILLDTEAKAVEQGDDGTLRLTVGSGDGEQVLEGSHLLVAVGRVPNTDALNLEAAGVETDKRGHIKVNERLETNVAGIYALGDVKGGAQFTHISYDDFRVIRANLLQDGNRSTEDRPVPYTVFIDPQLGRVGLTAAQARDAGRAIRVATMPMSSVARAIEVDETRGLMKAVVDADNDQILGCAILGIEGGELMSMLQIAMQGQLPYTALRDAVFAHPTLAEAFNNLFAGSNFQEDA